MGLELNEDGYIRQDGRHRTNLPGIYSAGDVEGGYKQIVTASGQGAEAAMTIFEDLINSVTGMADPAESRKQACGSFGAVDGDRAVGAPISATGWDRTRRRPTSTAGVERAPVQRGQRRCCGAAGACDSGA
ncbi:MAG: FAD-dependent oxidoreductase [Desulfobacterales bacterium]|nr:FAD-dependent oxidoreductase [Desulfobacterales bacterium]